MKKFLLSLLAITFLSGCSVQSYGKYTYDDADQYVEYKEPVTITNNDLEDLIVNWTSGDISITQKDEPLSFKETPKDLDNYHPLYYRQFNTGVEIQFVESGTTLNNDSSKTLEIVVPLYYRVIYVNTVSANSVIHLQDVDELDINTVSGNNTVDVNKIKQYLFNSVSGDCNTTIKDTSILNSVDISTVSGDNKLFLDSSRGYQLSQTTVSGKIIKNFEKSDLNPFNLFFNSVSGDLEINALSNE